MSLFRLPLGLCDGIQKVVARLWWGSKDEEKRNVHWARCDRMSQAKMKFMRSGLGFRDLSSFNRALIEKTKMENHLISGFTCDKSFKGQVFQIDRILGCKDRLQTFFHMEKHFMG